MAQGKPPGSLLRKPNDVRIHDWLRMHGEPVTIFHEGQLEVTVGAGRIWVEPREYTSRPKREVFVFSKIGVDSSIMFQNVVEVFQ